MRRALLASCLVGCAARSPVVRVAAAGASAFVGFGTGQALEGRWGDSGWKFAVADSAFIAGSAYGLRAVGCIDASLDGRCDELAYTTLWLGLLGLTVSHLWQVCAD